jgi:hypothetical protein
VVKRIIVFHQNLMFVEHKAQQPLSSAGAIVSSPSRKFNARVEFEPGG